MRRRNFVTAVAAALPAGTALVGQQPGQPPAGQPAPGIPANPTQSVPPPIRAADDTRLEVSVADAVAEPLPHFFTPLQFSAMKKLSGILMPAMGKTPGALEAGAAEFLDFLLGQSPADRQQLYRAGLDQLNANAKKQFKKSFAEVDVAQADTLLAPLREPWTHEPPKDPLARFLRAAKQDVRTATVNSREYSVAGAATARRNFGSGGFYWYPLG